MRRTKNLQQWYLPHHPVLSPHKPDKVRRVCNTPSKFHGTSLNDKLVPGPDLLRSLLGIIFRFRENKIAMTADIESMFLQVAVPFDSFGVPTQTTTLMCTSTTAMCLEPGVHQLVSTMPYSNQLPIKKMRSQKWFASWTETFIWMISSNH